MKRKMCSSAAAALLMTACVCLTACSRGATVQVPNGSPERRTASVVDAATSNLHARLVADARSNYQLGAERPPVPVPNGSIEHGQGVAGLSVSAYPMIRKEPLTPETNHFVGAFVSNLDYPRLGMGKHENYVLMLPRPGDTLYVMVPSDLSTPMSILDYDKHFTFYHTPHTPPQVVSEKVGTVQIAGRFVDEFVIGGCVEGPCPTGHCGVAGTADNFTFREYKARTPGGTPP